MSNEEIKKIPLEEEMQRSYLDYAMSVIVARALPDVRDGLKPVHRRILFAMKDNGWDHTKPHRKSARITGEVMAKYHPHGNAAIYDAMARMAQDFSLRTTLIDGQGNFGSVDGDPPAAERYTEARLEKVTQELLLDIDKNTVAFTENYDNSLMEPTVLPARFPNILANGAGGIAVGMATNIPPHNLGELLDACEALLGNPELTIRDLMQIVKGPDFPTGGTIIGTRGIYDAFSTGKGSITLRAKTEIETGKGDKESIIITEIPYQINKARLVERIAEMVRDKEIEGISEIRDESDRHGMRVVIEVKRDANAQILLNHLYKFTQMQVNFSSNVLALVKGKPQALSLKDCLVHFIDFRRDVIVRRTRFFLEKARARAHLLIGFVMALTNLDKVIEMIKRAKDKKEALVELMSHKFDVDQITPYLEVLHEPMENAHHLTERQAVAILELRLHRLTAMEQKDIKDELMQVTEDIRDYIDILSSKQRVDNIMIDEWKYIKDTYPSPRKTLIEQDEAEFNVIDLIPKEDMVVTVSLSGYVKRVPTSTYRAQARGGKGKKGMSMKEDDIISDIFIANTHSQLLFFSSFGKVYRLPVYQLPQGNPQSKGRALVNLLPLQSTEKISAILELSEENKDMSLAFVTSKGSVRRNSIQAFEYIPSSGKRAILLEDGEKLVSVKECRDEQDIFLVTRKGMYVRFNATKVRIFQSRSSTGVRGIKVGADDEVVSVEILDSFNLDVDERAAYFKQARGQEDEGGLFADRHLEPLRFKELEEKEQMILTITSNGYGKRSSSFEYRTTHRGGVGSKAILLSAKNGELVGAASVKLHEEIILITDTGRLIRTSIDEIRIVGRRTQGVIVLRMAKGEKVVGFTKVSIDEDADSEEVESSEE
ncbi:MAG: DNA gyrase subunit A [Alphaproteobacteria bacterium]|nr:MAG: DNA gyrase subunit A [Alphaproteobacteria bacterium]